jgi:integrase/recombinase XerC
LVLVSAAGTPLDRHNMLRAFKAAAKRAGVDEGRTHDLRHTFASWLRHAGVDLDVVQDLLGHASLITTQRYTHLGESKHDAIRSALEGADFAPSGGASESVAPSVPLDLDALDEAN